MDKHAAIAPTAVPSAQPTHYPRLLDPAAHPDYARRHVRVPTWETFGNRTQFMTLRSFSERDGKLVGFGEELDRYVDRFGLGRVIWPVFPTVFAANFWDLVEEIRQRGLFLFDIWGHVPGSGMEDMWSHVMPPPGMVERLERELGDHFLGFDNGEQDGRYIGSYAAQQCPSPQDRFRQYLNFQRHFERMCDDLGNHMSALVSLCFGHYFLKEGNHVLMGAETAQALPNSQVYYAFIRGAGKQYGVHWFGNASVWNRWGWKVYGSQGVSGDLAYGPTHGTSLALLKRLLYTHHLYNAVALGFESGWIIDRGGGDELTPIGRVQAAAARFVDQHGQPGVMHAPVALVLDHFAGWAMPRHLYTGSVYQVWGNMPYGPGDHLTHGVLSELFSGYEDASYFRDERGFLAPTPYGDIADCLLSDAPPWVLDQYGLVILAGALSAHAELCDTLDRFMERGGQVVVTAENARRLWPEWEIGDAVRMPAGTRVRLMEPPTAPGGPVTSGAEIVEDAAFDLCSVPPDGAEVLAHAAGKPVVIRRRHGRGAATIILSPFGINAEPLCSGPIRNEPEAPLACPHALLRHVRAVLGRALASQQLFSVGEGLSFITCRKGPGEYTIGIQNNGLVALPFRIESRCGRIARIAELPLDQSEKGAVGYWPDGRENAGGVSDATTIAGGDVRLFSVSVEETGVRLLDPVRPPERPKNRILRLPHDAASIKEEILRRPTFFQHFDGVKVDWTYLRRRDPAEVCRERGWLDRQKVRVVVDFSTGLNFYPDLTLLDTLAFRYEESVAAIDDVLDKMRALGAADAIISLHRKPENHCDDARADDCFLAGVRDLARRAAERGVTLYLARHPHKWYAGKGKMRAFIDEVGAANLRVAVSASHGDALSADAVRDAGAVLLSAAATDLFGQDYDAHLPVAGSGLDLAALRAVPEDALMVLDAEYPDWSTVWRDLCAIEGTLARG